MESILSIGIYKASLVEQLKSERETPEEKGRTFEDRVMGKDSMRDFSLRITCS